MIDPDHVQIEIWPPRPKGGQHVGSGPSGVKVTHNPSGITACVDIGRSPMIATDMILSAVTHPRYRVTREKSGKGRISETLGRLTVFAFARYWRVRGQKLAILNARAWRG